MKQVKIKRDELLDIVKKNLTEHRDLFLKAQEGYREMVIEELDKMLADARNGKELRVAIHMPAPEDHSNDYTTVIKMLELEVEENVCLETHEFQQYVENNWRWAAAALATNTMYASKSWK